MKQWRKNLLPEFSVDPPQDAHGYRDDSYEQ